MLLGVGSSRDEKVADTKTSVFRRFVAGAISLLSPSLGQWVMVAGTGKSSPTTFYYQMTGLLEPVGLVRRPTQTHREFATEVSHFFAEHPASALISSTVREITELFNEVRFGKQKLPADLLDQVDISIKELKQSLVMDAGVLEDRANFPSGDS
jgi:hypothetical protein